ncbi:hypothetical protein NC653_004833 [Populus alba x Populus x berolinensis]|uniref:Uncharacterized protein n=1 Tax=Populus alba x Populus x berolinensis TaxID=444605 RepID=A0AAD6WKE9_9ROSI|nr:hypothetical protein NC653_004833 [Populus alba x Populus x berolinensis]
MEDFGKFKGKIQDYKQVYVVGFVRKTRHFSSQGSDSCKRGQRQQENAFPTQKPSCSSFVNLMNQQP